MPISVGLVSASGAGGRRPRGYQLHRILAMRRDPAQGSDVSDATCTRSSLNCATPAPPAAVLGS
jgi:hypothetical protein